MKYLDFVEVAAERSRYAKNGVHKGMQGVIWMEDCIDGEWDVYFCQLGEKEDIGDMGIKEEDLKLIPMMHAVINEQIKAEFETGFCDGGKIEGDNCVEVTAEVPEYVKHDVHREMQGLILPERAKEKGDLIVRFPQSGGEDDIAKIPVKEENLMHIPVMYAVVNNVLKEHFEWKRQHMEGDKK